MTTRTNPLASVSRSGAKHACALNPGLQRDGEVHDSRRPAADHKLYSLICVLRVGTLVACEGTLIDAMWARLASMASTFSPTESLRRTLLLKYSKTRRAILVPIVSARANSKPVRVFAQNNDAKGTYL